MRKKNKDRIKDKTKLKPILLICAKYQSLQKYCTLVMFARFVCALLSFCARKFPAKSETREPREIIVEFTSYICVSLPFIIYLTFIGYPCRDNYGIFNVTDGFHFEGQCP